jgi:hypothetical protein
LINEIKCPVEFVDVMPYSHTGYYICKRYYWKEQVEFAYLRYFGLSKIEKITWLCDKVRAVKSIMKYVRKREFGEERFFSRFRRFFFQPHAYCDADILLYIPFISQYPPQSPPPFSPFPPLFVQSVVKEVKNVEKVKDISQLIQFHIKRLKNESYQFTFNEKTKLDAVNNFLKNSSKERKRNNFIKTKKKKVKGELNNNELIMKMKGKNFKNKFAHKYG